VVDVVASPADVPVQAPRKGFVLRQEGTDYNVGDAAMLQRWIVERRVGPDDEISEDEGPFRQVGDIEAFQIFFQLVEDVEKSAKVQSAIEVPTPAFVSKGSNTKLFSRPKPSDLSQIGQGSAETPSKTVAEVAPDLPSELPPEPEPETEVAEAPVASPDPEPATEEAQFGEVIPDEAPAAFTGSLLDDPTIDMELGQDDFFSEEETVVAGGTLFEGDEDDFDDDLEWGQTRRKSMAMWWLIFFGGLGGAGYFALDFISSSEKESAVVAAPQAVEAPPVAADKPEEPEDTAGAAAEKPADAEADSVDGAAAASEPPPSKPEPEAPASKSAAPAPKAAPSAAKKPAPPARPNADREIDRGWTQIDRKNWSKARAHFTKALSVAPGNVDGRYGMAYVNEHQGRVAEAVSQYCRLVKTTTGEIRKEVNGRLRTLDKECP